MCELQRSWSHREPVPGIWPRRSGRSHPLCLDTCLDTILDTCLHTCSRTCVLSSTHMFASTLRLIGGFVNDENFDSEGSGQARLCACIYACLCMHLNTCLCTCLWTYLYTQMSIHMYYRTCMPMSIHMHVYTYVYTQVHTHVSATQSICIFFEVAGRDPMKPCAPTPRT